MGSRLRWGCFLALAGSVPVVAQQLSALPPVADFPRAHSPLAIRRETNPTKPFSVVGQRGALLGQQDGSFEAWLFPWKLLSNLRIGARMADYDVPIDVNEYAAAIDVEPDHTTITYAHANFTVRETLLAPANAGAAVYFEVESVRPLDLTFSFTPQMKAIWPAASDDVNPEWVKTQGGSGFYILHQNFPAHAAAIAIPGAEPGILAPYQERPKTYPLELVLHVDPAKDKGTVYPLLMATGETVEAASAAGLHHALLDEDTSFAAAYGSNAAEYGKFLARTTAIETPDRKLDQAFRWAELSIEQLRVQTIPSHSETALVAGFYSSGDSARPGFGWFFGRDALFTLYAVDSYGDFALARQELDFLLKRQRADGKGMHEWSQAAELVDWAKLPYEYASADGTPLLLMAAADYLRCSGDAGYVREHWAQLEKAWAFETSHDSDHDGIYENTEGTGWVESWPPGMPHQEIYLAAMDEQASQAYAALARAVGRDGTAAEMRAKTLAATIEREYYVPATKSYAFSRNADGTLDTAATIFPAVAWWDGDYGLKQAGPMLARWASPEFSTDWGTRDLSPATAFYDPISYHQGTVWPLYTGWASLAEYRAGRTLSGYDHLMQNANLTWAQDLGAVTELLSGEFFRPLGRSTSHQLWSSAMVVTPVLRGMFGLGWSAGILTVAPRLPAAWDHALLRRVTAGDAVGDIRFERKGAEWVVTATGGLKLAGAVAGVVHVPMPAIEVGLPSELPVAGARTMQTKVLDQEYAARKLTLRLMGQGGAKQEMLVRNNGGVKVAMDGNALGVGATQTVVAEFPAGVGYVEKTIIITW